MQLDMTVLARTTRHVILATDIAGGKRHPLPGEEMQALAARRGEVQGDDALVDDFHGLHPGGDALQRNVVGAGNSRLHHHIADRRVGTEQEGAVGLLVLFQHVIMRMHLPDLA